MAAARSAKTASKRPTKSYERPGLSEEEIEEIREAFNLFDTDGSGELFSLYIDICLHTDGVGYGA